MKQTLFSLLAGLVSLSLAACTPAQKLTDTLTPTQTPRPTNTPIATPEQLGGGEMMYMWDSHTSST